MHPARAALAALTAATLLAGAMPAWPQTPAISPEAAAAIADYQAKLGEYDRIHGPFEREDEAYWHAVAEKRKLRNAKRGTARGRGTR